MTEPIVSQRFAIAGSGSTKLAVVSNLPLDVPDSNIRRAIIYVHGTGAPAHKYYARAMQAVRGVDARGTRDGVATPNHFRRSGDVLVIAPQFITPGDFVGPGPIPPDVLYWNSAFWGNDAVNGGNPSSFHALDEIIRHLCDVQNYRRLGRIVLAGHSGGGQILNRYAAAGDGETLYARPRNIRVRYIVMNPGSYMYFSPQRRIGGSESSFSVATPPGCPGFDLWGYGLSGPLTNYHASRGLGRSQLEARYEDRDVIYLNGADDSNPTDPSMPSGCAAGLQGAHRLQRSRVYFNYLVHHFGTDVLAHQQHAIIPDVAHSGGGMIRSPITRRFMMEDFEARPRLTRTADSGGQAGSITRIVVMRHWDDLDNNCDNQFVTAIRDQNNKLKLIGWRVFENGELQRSSSSEPTADSVRVIGMTRVLRTDTVAGGSVRRMTYVTCNTAAGSRLHLLSWDTDSQGSLRQLTGASRSSTGRAQIARIVRLSDTRFATVQKNTSDRLIVRIWSVGNGGTITRLATTPVIGGAVDEVQLVRRNRNRVIVVATIAGGLRFVHLTASASGTTPATISIDSDQALPTDIGDNLCASITPYRRLVVGYRDSASQRFKLVTFRVNSSGQTRLYDSGNQVGKINSGTSIMTMNPYGICTAVRTLNDKGKLIFWRITPGGAIKRVADSGSSMGQVKRHHGLADQASVVGGDLFFGCADANGKMKLLRYRYKS